MSPDDEQRIDRYADLIVRVGVNVQPGQTVFVDRPRRPRAARPRGRRAPPTRAGARYVDVRYVDPHVRKAFIELAPDEDLTETPAVAARAGRGARSTAAALIMIAGEAEPELLAGLDQSRVGKARPIAG